MQYEMFGGGGGAHGGDRKRGKVGTLTRFDACHVGNPWNKRLDWIGLLVVVICFFSLSKMPSEKQNWWRCALASIRPHIQGFMGRARFFSLSSLALQLIESRHHGSVFLSRRFTLQSTRLLCHHLIVTTATKVPIIDIVIVLLTVTSAAVIIALAIILRCLAWALLSLMLGIGVVILWLAYLHPVLAVDGNEFANNLFSDLGTVLYSHAQSTLASLQILTNYGLCRSPFDSVRRACRHSVPQSCNLVARVCNICLCAAGYLDGGDFCYQGWRSSLAQVYHRPRQRARSNC